MAVAYRKNIGPELVAHRSKGADVRSVHESIPESPYNSAQLAKNVLKENEAAHTVMGHMKTFGQLTDKHLKRLFPSMGRFSIENIDNYSSTDKFIKMAKRNLDAHNKGHIELPAGLRHEFESLISMNAPKIYDNRRRLMLSEMLERGFHNEAGTAIIPKMSVGTKYIEGSTRIWEGTGTSGNLSNVIFDKDWVKKYDQFLEHGYYGTGKIVDDVVDDMLLFD